MKTPFRSALLTCFLSALSHTVAAPLIESLNYARFYGASDPRAFLACYNPGSIPCSGSAAVPGTNWTLNYYSENRAQFGLLGGFAQAFLTGSPGGGAFPSFASVGARGSFQDTFTFSGGGIQGPTGSAIFTFAITGSGAATVGQSARPQIYLIPVFSNGEPDWAHQMPYLLNSQGNIAVPVSFRFNNPVEFRFEFYALAQIYNWVAGASATANYLHTAALDKIEVFDASGQPVQDFSIVSASGTAYTAGGVVPEPSTMVLCLGGLLVLVVARLRRRSL